MRVEGLIFLGIEGGLECERNGLALDDVYFIIRKFETKTFLSLYSVAFRSSQ